MSGIPHYNLKKVMKRTMWLPMIESLETMAKRGGFSYAEDLRKAPKGMIQKAEFLADVVRRLDDRQKDIIHAEFQWLNMMAFTPKITTNILRELENAGAEVDKAVKSTTVATMAAYAYAHIPVEAWRRLCTQTQIMQINKNAWTTVRVKGVPDGYAIDSSDLTQEAIKKSVCGYIYQTEGRAEQGYCSYYLDEARGEHIFRIVMTDHPQFKKFWVKKSVFRERNFRDTAELVFRYVPSLGELSVCSDGDEPFDKSLCECWRDAAFADLEGVTIEIVEKCAYNLDIIKRHSGKLDIPDGSKVKNARVILASVEDKKDRSDWTTHHASRRNDVHTKLVNEWRSGGRDPDEFIVKRLEIEFDYVDPCGAEMTLKCNFTRSSSNWMSQPSDAQKYIREILEMAGIIDVRAA